MIKAAFIFFITLLISCSGKSQVIDKSLLLSFYIKHINYTYSDSFLEQQQKKYNFILVLNDLKNEIKIKDGEKIFFFIPDTCHLVNFMVNPFKKNVGRIILKIKHSLISQDTIDIYDSNINVNEAIKRKGKRIWNISNNSCKGGCGYIADGRFIYSNEEKKWIYYTFLNDCKTITVQRIE